MFAQCHRWDLVAALLWLEVGIAPAAAQPGACGQAALQAEQAFALPAGLLSAIGAVESDNTPWSVDVDGAGYRFANAAEAAGFVQAASRAGGRFIDVGCFQIDLRYHGDVFTDLDQAFDPLSNAMAAGRVLRSLRDAAPSWPVAVARYHSFTAIVGPSYAARVLASMEGRRLGPPRLTWRDDRLAYGMRVITPAASQLPRGGVLRTAGLPTVYTP